MSVAILSACWDISLPHSEKLVLIALADQANDTGECWPSIATVMRRTGLSDRSLQRIILKLEKRGLLRRHYRSGHSTRYLLPNLIHTPDTMTPRHIVTPDTVSPTPRHSVTPAPDILSGTPPTSCQGRTVIEPSVEPSRKRVSAARFTPPTLKEVREFILEHRYTVDPVKWWNHYEANGWRVGRNPMKDWRAAVRTWTRGDMR